MRIVKADMDPSHSQREYNTLTLKEGMGGSRGKIQIKGRKKIKKSTLLDSLDYGHITLLKSITLFCETDNIP